MMLAADDDDGGLSDIDMSDESIAEGQMFAKETAAEVSADEQVMSLGTPRPSTKINLQWPMFSCKWTIYHQLRVSTLKEFLASYMTTMPLLTTMLMHCLTLICPMKAWQKDKCLQKKQRQRFLLMSR